MRPEKQKLKSTHLTGPVPIPNLSDVVAPKVTVHCRKNPYGDRTYLLQETPDLTDFGFEIRRIRSPLSSPVEVPVSDSYQPLSSETETFCLCQSIRPWS